MAALAHITVITPSAWTNRAVALRSLSYQILTHVQQRIPRKGGIGIFTAAPLKGYLE